MKKYICMLGCVGILAACSKKNGTQLPQHNIMAEIEIPANNVGPSTMTIMQTVNGKTTQVYNGTGDNQYKFTASVGAQIKITVTDSYDASGFDHPDLLVTDNGNTVSGIQNNYNDGSFSGQVTFTINK